MNKFGFFRKLRRRGLAVWLCLLATQGLRASVTFTNTPAAIDNSYAGLITLQIGGLNAGETVVVRKFIDFNRNGVVDPGELMVGQFNLTDGVGGMVIGGVTNGMVPGDTDATAGQITAKINLALTGFDQTIVGQYLYVVSSPTARFAPLTNSFTVTNASFGQTISGNVLNNGTNLPYAIVLLLVPKENGNSSPQAGVVSDASGHFMIGAATGGYGLLGISPGFVADTSVAPFFALNSGAAITTNVTLNRATQTIAGSLVDTNNSAIRLPGVLVPGQTSSGLLTIAYSDTNGNFTLTTTPNTWKINGQDSAIAAQGYVGPNNSLRVNSTAGSLSGVTIGFTRANALFYGRVTDAVGNPVPGIDIFAGDNSNNSSSLYGVDAYSDANGYYFCGVVGGLGANDTWFIGPSNDSNPANLIFGTPAFEQNGGTNLGAGQAALANFTAVVATNQISGTVKDGNGHPIAGVGVAAYATINGQNFNLNNVDTDTNGNYTLTAANGDWGVFVFCNGGNDSLDNILGNGNYECPNTVFVTVNNNNPTVNITVPPAGGHQIYGYVRDTGNNPIPGVSVYANGNTGLITTTDNNGYYSFNVGNGTWNIGVDCGELTSRGYSCAAGQQVNIANNDSENDFSVSLCEPLAITTGDTLGDADATFSYNYPLQNVGCHGPFTWSLTPGSLGVPQGLNLLPSGVISGIASTNAIGTNYFSLRVTDNSGATADQFVSIAVYPAPKITNSSLPNATVNTFYSVQLGSAGGDSPLFGWNLVSGSPPPGLTLFLNGAISGTPSQAGAFTFTVYAGDNTGAQPQKTLSITVIGSLQVTTTTLATAYTGAAYSAQLQASGGNTPYRWSVANGSQPPPAGLTLSTNGLIAGTPTGGGTSSFIVKVTDANNATATKSLSLTINSRPTISSPRLGTGTFVFTVNGVAGQNYTIQFSATLTNWSTLFVTNSATPSFQVADPLNGKARNYRVLIGP